jgi:thymidylate synthase
MQIRAETLAEAHEGAIDAVLEWHKKQAIQTHKDKVEQTIEFEDEDGSDDILVLKISNPQVEPQVSAGCLFKEKFTEAYKKQFLTLTPPRPDGKQATYTYWNRLEDYPHLDDASDKTYEDSEGETTSEWVGDGDGRGWQQVTDLIKKLAKDSKSRRAVAVTWNPLLDSDSDEPPCMNWVQFVIRNGKVHMRVLFRSQDILSGLGENLVGCAAFQKKVVDGINEILGEIIYECGSIILISTIPHIYQIRDSCELNLAKIEINRKKTLGLWKVQVTR